MHDDELDIDPDVVRELIATQFPEWSGEPLTRVHGSGTVNAIFRIGDRLAARFPLRGTDAATSAQLRAEASAMEELAGRSPFPVPRHVAIGRPGSGYPLAWSVQTWLEGDVATPTDSPTPRCSPPTSPSSSEPCAPPTPEDAGSPAVAEAATCVRRTTGSRSASATARRTSTPPC